VDRELALALSFDKAPEELKELAHKHQQNFLDLETCQHQAALWLKQKEQAEKSYDLSGKEFRKAINVWLEKNVKTQDPQVIEKAR
jgi:hypothetical protein